MHDRSPASPRRQFAAFGASKAPLSRAEILGEPCDSPRIGYRCELRRHGDPEPRQVYYDGGDYSPYCLDSLADLLRCEARLPHSALEIRIDLTGPCPGAVLREMTLRFSSLGIARLHVVIRAEGHAPIVLGAEHASAGDPPPAKPSDDA